jgi:hypothetical protein
MDACLKLITETVQEQNHLAQIAANERASQAKLDAYASKLAIHLPVIISDGAKCIRNSPDIRAVFRNTAPVVNPYSAMDAALAVAGKLFPVPFDNADQALMACNLLRELIQKITGEFWGHTLTLRGNKHSWMSIGWKDWKWRTGYPLKPGERYCPRAACGHNSFWTWDPREVNYSCWAANTHENTCIRHWKIRLEELPDTQEACA